MSYSNEQRRVAQLSVAVAVTCSVGILGCDGDVALPKGASRFAPSALYQSWWASTEECSGLTRPIGEVRWYSAPLARSSGRDSTPSGYYDFDNSLIVIAEDHLLDGSLVRHEMLHALTRTERTPGHPRNLFLDRCAAYVACEDECVADSDPAGPEAAGALHVSPSALWTSITIEPTDVSLSGFDHLGYAMVTVSIGNPQSQYLTVDLPMPAPVGPSIVTQGLPTNITRNSRIHDIAALRFGPGEVKRQVFDLYLLEASGPAAGSYSLVAKYAGQSQSTTGFKVVP